MADNENIFVEFDYQNIIVVDPNKTVDLDGKAKERLINHEDLVMYANLECSLIPRTKLILGKGQNEVQTIELAKINFLKPTGKEKLDNSYIDFFTSSANTENGVVESSLLGITNINFRVNTSFMPTITMTLEDIRGRALFELGDKSPYAAFFNLPYPSFFLTLKGYYGKAVRYQLMLQNFNARFDNNTGNFVIDLTFLTYKFTVLSEVSMGYALAVPYMYNNVVTKKSTNQNSNVTDVPVSRENITLGHQKIKELYGEYKSKGLIKDDLPEYTIVQLQKKLDSFIKEVLIQWGEENLEPLTNVQTYSKILNDYVADLKTRIDSPFVKYIDTQNSFILKKGGVVYVLKQEFRNDPQKVANINSEFLNIIKTYNGKLDSNPTCGKGGKSEIKNRCKVDNSNVLPDWIATQVSIDDIDKSKTFQLQYRKNYNDQINETEKKKFDSDLNILFGLDNLNQTTEQSPNTQQPVKKFYKFEGDGDFLGLIANMQKDLKNVTDEIYKKISESLNNILKNGSNDKAGLGFVPTIRNVMAILFANGEAFLRLLDDTHTEAWNKKESEIRKKAILGTTVQNSDNSPTSQYNNIIFPWPQLIVESDKDGIKTFDVTYPGDPSVISETQGYLYDEWPEIEFVEEFLYASLNKETSNSTIEPDSTESTGINRITFNAVEYPVSNQIYQNKEEIKFFYELWERMGFVTNFSRLTRGNPNQFSITDIIGESESLNIQNSLGETNVFLIKKLKEYLITPTNIRSILRSISNNGEGESYQKFIRGYYSTPYITSFSENDFNIYGNSIFNILNGADQNQLKVNENQLSNIKNYLTSSSTNEFQFTDTYPFNNLSWVNNNLANGEGIGSIKTVLKTDKVINYNENINAISNFTIDDNDSNKKPFTYFNFTSNQETPTFSQNQNVTTSNLKNIYNERIINKNKQLPTEGSLSYQNYDGHLTQEQTTSILNTPYFVNSIQKGVDNFRRSVEFPYVASAYLFLNSLPLTNLSEKFKTKNTNTTDELDYMFATFKKYGAIHKLPYAWILKYGSIWHRYKKKVENNIDILDDVWKDFNYLENYDPITSASTKVYTFTNEGESQETRIILQANDVNNVFTSTTINVGFYPKLINDFSVFYNGYRVFVGSGYTDQDIQLGITSGLTVFRSSSIVTPFGFDPNVTNRTLNLNSYSITLNDGIDSNFYLIPSVGNSFNQTLNECFNNIDTTTANAKLQIEVTDNQSMYNGSVRTLWVAPNYGWFDNSKVIKPQYDEYLKKIISNSNDQNNFEINGKLNGYSKTYDLLPTFKKQILDEFEQIFLNFCNSKYDFKGFDQLTSVNVPINELNSNEKFQNFQILFTEMMKLPIDKKSVNVNELKTIQYQNFRTLTEQFLNYNVLFKYGNPSEYNKINFLSFTNPSSVSFGYDSVFNPYIPKSYAINSPLALPSKTNPFPLVNVSLNYPNAWKTLLTYVGDSEVDKIKFTNSGSTVFDFFIDNDVEFNVENIENLYPLIKIYATKKSENETYDSFRFKTDMLDYINGQNNFQNLILDSTMTKLRSSLPNVNFTPQPNVASELIGTQGKVDIWESFKAINDKWISGYDIKYKTLFEDLMLLDRASRDIGDKILVDIIKLNKLLSNINVTSNLLYYIQSILVSNNFQVMSLPAFVNFYNVQDPVKNSIPRVENSLEFANDMFGTFTNVDYRNSGPKMVCFYADKPSEHLKQETPNYLYGDDGVYFQKLNTNTLTDNLTNKTDWGLSNRVVGFSVDMGVQNQGVFTNISVSQDAGKSTSESLRILTEMANQAGGRKTSTQNTSLYNLYKNRSYSCTIDMMGNAMIQPMMYFNLRHVPMFSGAYMILGVDHNITPGEFRTKFTGIRQSIYSYPNPDSYLQSILTNLINNVQTIVKQEKQIKNSQSQNTPQESQNQNGNNQNNQPSLNQDCVVNSQFNNYQVVTPQVTTTNFKEMITKITGSTKTLSPSPLVTDKINYIMWSIFYLYTSNDAGFKTYNNNYNNLKLDIKINNQEKKLSKSLVSSYLKKEFFCIKSNDTQYAFASYSNLENCIGYTSNYLKQRVSRLNANIKTNGAINYDDLSKKIYEFIFINWPVSIAQSEYNKISNNQTTKDYINLIKNGLQVAFENGL